MSAAAGFDPAGSVALQPLRLRNLTVKNRVFRSSVAGRFDNYDGSGTETRIAWDVKFARGGVGAIVSSNAPVHPRGALVPGYAHADRDDTIPFWRELGRRVHEHDCRYVLQLVHAGRERMLPRVEHPLGLSPTSKRDPVHGFEAERMTVADIRAVVAQFAAGARRARAAGLDGVEVMAAHGVLLNQFLSPAINDRADEYGGPLENRARLLLEVVRAIRAEVGDDFFLSVKLSVVDRLDELFPWLPSGTGVEESVEVCRRLEQAGVDAIHVSAGAAFPHPRNTPGAMPAGDLARTYDTMLSSGRHTLRNWAFFRSPLGRLFDRRWRRPSRRGAEGVNLPLAHAVKAAVGIPVICTGGFQTASMVAHAIERGDCDAVSIARGLIANPDLVRQWEAGRDRPERPCTHSNRCLAAFLELPLACYDERRFDSREEMYREALSVYAAPAYATTTPTAEVP